jgi:dihydrofolate synthase / folylpolyglutamate synthase
LDIETILQRYEHFGVHLGLEAIQQLLADLGNPHLRVPIIHVAGSNGKGSVCAYLSAVLTHAGYRVGRYTSPHLVRWNERICLNEQPITTSDFTQVLQQVEAAIRPDLPSPTQFEVITAAMWLYFAQQQVDIAVVEVGLGGRLDATNVCDRPLVSIIVSISREHWQRLGSTLGQIAREKAGILKPYCPAVIGQLPAGAQTVIAQRVGELACPVVYPEPAVLAAPEAAEPGSDSHETNLAQVGDPISNSEKDLPSASAPLASPSYPWVIAQGIHYQLPLAGEIQRYNSALAIAAFKILQQQGWQRLSDPVIAEGMAQAKWPGRLQWLTWKDHQLLVDGAHNPASAQVLRHYVESLSSPLSRHWVMGMLSTKDHQEVFEALLRSGDALYLVPVPGHSSASPSELATRAQATCPNLAHCAVYPDLWAGLQAATAAAGLTILCGSLYLLGTFFQVAE